MDYLQMIMGQLSRIQYTDVLDILVVATLIYFMLPIFRSTGTARIAWVVVGVVVVASLASLLKMHALSFVLSQLLGVGLVAIVVLFQPELRRMLDHVSHIKLKEFLGMQRQTQDMAPVIAQTVNACEVMSRERVGALIVFTRDNRLEEYFKTGTVLDAQVSEQLIRNVFFPKASLHDGAMIIRDGRVAAAGCVLPLSNSKHLHADLGTRHRAGVGMSEASDAVVVIVSEETGVISVAVGGVLKRHLAPQTLERLLLNELCPETPEEKVSFKEKLKKRKENKKIKAKGDKGNEE